jgi:DNA polymerase-3 subunit delta
MKRATNTQISFNALEQALRRKEFSPVYLFYGEEDFLAEEALQLLTHAAVEESTRSFNLDIVYGSEVDARHIAALAASFPMMGERRVVAVREFDKLPNKEPLLSYLSHPSPTTTLALLAPKPDFRLSFYKAVRESAVAVECKPLSEQEIPRWIVRKAGERGKSISDEACEMMQSYLGRSLREIHNEIEKVALFVGDRTTIEEQDVTMVVGMSRTYNVFELQNAVGSKDLPRALEILEHLMDAGEQPVGMIVMLTRYLQRLWLIRDSLVRHLSREELTALLHMSPKQQFWLETEIGRARLYAPAQLERGFTLLRNADERLKSSNGDPKLVMTLLLYHLVQGEMAEQEA